MNQKLKRIMNTCSSLHSEIAMFDCDLKSKEEVIHLLGSRMITEGYVDEGFIDSVFERENLSETALGNLTQFHMHLKAI